MKQPDLILADHPYFVTLPPNNNPYTITFNDTVLKSLLKNEYQPYIKRILFTIQKGFVGQLDSSGIKLLHQNNSASSRFKSTLLEIKFIGNTLGHVRIGGFIDGRNIHLTVFKTGSDHSKKKSAFKEAIYNSFLNFQN